MYTSVVHLAHKSLFIVTVTLIAACATTSPEVPNNSPMNSPEGCAAQDGEWMPFKELYPGKTLSESDLRRYVCNLRTHEIGKTCTDNRQCKGYCMAPAGSKSGQKVIGECSAYVQRMEGVLTVQDGQVTYPMTSSEMTEIKVAMLQRFAAARQRWSSLGISNYEITIADQNCYCLYGPYYGPNRVIVRDGKISRVVYLGERRDGFQRGDSLTRKDALKHTIDEIFDNLERTIRQMTANTNLIVEYDAQYGFPTLVDFDRPDWEDEQSRLVVSNFKMH